MFSVADDTMTVLLALAKEYQVDHIRTKCEQWIGAQIKLVHQLDTTTLLLYLLSCDQFGLNKHLEQLKDIAARRKTSELTGAWPDRYPFPTSSTMDVFRIRCEKLEAEIYRLRKSQQRSMRIPGNIGI